MTDTAPASGTRDFLPGEVRRRERVFATLRQTFAAHGFAPIDTPAFERLEVLMGKYGEEGDQLVFKILRRGEHEDTGEADLALRYDLTVPLARFMAANIGELGTPFKRYHIGPVWRADRPGHGRFREFVQCDIDTVGADSPMADAGTILALVDALGAIGLDDFTIQLNSRRALRGLMDAYGVPDEVEQDALIALDKLDKIGPEGVVDELLERGVPADAVDELEVDLRAGSPDAVAERARRRIDEAGGGQGRAGLEQVDTVLELTRPRLAEAGPAVGIAFRPLLARGLDYYTGPIFEIVHEGLDSTIAAGGRYDDLVGMFTGQELPATGGSIGVERVLMLLEDEPAGAAASPVVVTVMDGDARGEATELAARLRAADIGADVFPGEGRLGKQLTYADRRGATVALIRGDDERAAGTVAVKDLVSGEQTPVDEDDLLDHLDRRLG